MEAQQEAELELSGKYKAVYINQDSRDIGVSML